MPKQVTILRSDNRIVLDPTDRTIRGLIEPQLTYIEKKWVQTAKERRQRRQSGMPPFDEIIWECYGEDHRGRLATSYGFYERISEVLESNGYQVDLRWGTRREAEVAAERAKTVYEPRWDRIQALIDDGFEFRYKQKPALKLIAKHENGRIDCHGGWGKGTLIMLACKLFPKAKIDVVTKRVPVLHQRLYPELAMNLPSVGIVGGGKRKKGCRVMCITADSLHHGRPDADFVFVDEGDEACADKFAGSLGQYEHARMWAFSATWNMRGDNKNLRGEAIFGPIRLSVPYQEGVEHDIVVPIEVHWDNVIMDVNPAADKEGPEKKRAAYWSNTYRNKVIKKITRRYDDDIQVLIAVDTLEHALHLKKLLPEFELVYSPKTQKDEDWEWFDEKGLLPEGFKVITDERREKITKRFEKGRLKKAIATTVWNVGVNFRHLQVVIRADGGDSQSRDTQLPCRNARKHVEGDHLKPIGIIHDLKDQFDRGCRGRAERRRANYEKNGWKQVDPQKSSKLRAKMKWGD